MNGDDGYMSYSSNNGKILIFYLYSTKDNPDAFGLILVIYNYTYKSSHPKDIFHLEIKL